MKVTRPIDKEAGVSQFDEAIVEFERELLKQRDGKDSYNMIVFREFNRRTCDEVEKAYRNAGWKQETCKTSEDGATRTTILRLSY